jgi:hypothetical protein
VFKEHLCTKCGNRFHYPVWYSRNKIEEYSRGPKECECKNKKFKDLGYFLGKTNYGCSRGKILMAEGKASTRNYLIVHKICECKGCKSQYFFPMAIEDNALVTEAFDICKCGKNDFIAIGHMLRKKLACYSKLKVNLLMVKK